MLPMRSVQERKSERGTGGEEEEDKRKRDNRN
jgi:hypothetical protein